MPRGTGAQLNSRKRRQASIRRRLRLRREEEIPWASSDDAPLLTSLFSRWLRCLVTFPNPCPACFSFSSFAVAAAFDHRSAAAPAVGAGAWRGCCPAPVPGSFSCPKPALQPASQRVLLVGLRWSQAGVSKNGDLCWRIANMTVAHDDDRRVDRQENLMCSWISEANGKAGCSNTLRWCASPFSGCDASRVDAYIDSLGWEKEHGVPRCRPADVWGFVQSSSGAPAVCGTPETLISSTDPTTSRNHTNTRNERCLYSRRLVPTGARC